MAIGPHDPTWRRLYEELERLASSSGAAFAFVLDEGNGLWCVAIAGEPPTTATSHEDRAADRFYANEIVPRISQLRQGHHVELTKEEGEDRYVAMSFAGLYMLVVWFMAPFHAEFVRARMRRALPEIERLTLALPPSDDPTRDAGAMRRRA